MCKAGSREHSASKYWLKILARESSSSDPDVYFSSKCIYEQCSELFHKLLSKRAERNQVYFMLRTILLQWFIFISPNACSSCWIRWRRVAGSVCNTWAVWSSFWLRCSFIVTAGLICCLRLLLASCRRGSVGREQGNDRWLSMFVLNSSHQVCRTCLKDCSETLFIHIKDTHKLLLCFIIKEY